MESRVKRNQVVRGERQLKIKSGATVKKKAKSVAYMATVFVSSILACVNAFLVGYPSATTNVKASAILAVVSAIVAFVTIVIGADAK